MEYRVWLSEFNCVIFYMAHGLIQLVSVGEEDKILTTDPQITFFKTMYRRHSNFSLFQHKIPFNGMLKFGSETTCVVEKIGDLLHKLFIVMDLPPIHIASFQIKNNVKMLLSSYKIYWYFENNDDINNDDIDDITLLIDQRIIDLTTIVASNTIKLNNLQSNIDLNPNTTPYNLFQYILNFSSFLLPNSYKIVYDFINAYSLDSQTVAIHDLDYIQNTFYYTLRSYYDGNTDISQSIFVIKPDIISYLPNAYTFISNIEFGNYNNVDLLNNLSLFHQQLEFIYLNDEIVDKNYKILDPYLTMINYFNQLPTLINNNTSLYNVLSYLVQNMITNMRVNLEILYNLFTFISNSKYTFYILKKYKFQTGTQPNDITARFINISLQNILSFNRLDKFTNYILEDSNLPGSVYQSLNNKGILNFYGSYVKSSIATFNTNIAALFNNEIYSDYFKNNITELWNRLLITDATFTSYIFTQNSNFSTKLSGLMLLNFIPIILLDDINIEINRYANIIYFGNAAILTSISTLINNLKNTIKTNIFPSLKIDENDVTNLLIIVAGYQQNSKDKFLFGLLRPEPDMSQYIQNYIGYLSPMKYMQLLYLTEVINFLNTNSATADVINTFTVVINSFFAQSISIPIYSRYQRFLRIYDGNNVPFFVQPVDIICDVASSIWFNIQNDFIPLFNNMFNNEILNLSFYKNSLGADIYSDLDYIVTNFINQNYILSNYIDYYALNSDIIYTNNQTLNVSITNYMFEENQHQLYYNKNYDLTKNLLKIKFLQLNRQFMNYETTQNILTKFHDIISGNNEYGYNVSSQTILDSILNNVIFQISNQNLKNVSDVINLLIPALTFGLNPSNPYISGTNLYNWHVNNNIDTISNSAAIQNTLQNILSNLTPEYIYNDVVNSEKNAILLTTNQDVLTYVLSYITKINNIYISNSSIQEIYDNYVNMYIDNINSSTVILNEIGSSKLLNTIKKMVINSEIPFSWIDFIGYFCIDYVSLVINQQEIDRHTGSWLYIQNNLYSKHEHKRGNDVITGNIKILTNYDTKIKESYKLFIPLQFWFCRYVEESLPIIALNNSEIFVKVKLKNIEDVCKTNATNLKNFPMSGYLLGEFIYVDVEERKTISQTKHEYLIENVICETNVIDYTRINDKLNGIIEIKIKTIEMCKEIIWTIQTGTNVKNKKYNDFSYNGKNPCLSMKLIFCGNDREISKEIEVYNWIMPYQCHTASPDVGINVYSFGLYPESMQPSGSASLVHIDARLELTLNPQLVEDMKNNNEYLFVNTYLSTQNIFRIMSGLSGLMFYG